MNRREFFTELIRELKDIEPSELQDILQYYNEFFDDAGVENEQQVLNELGSPKEIAATIKADCAVKYLKTENTSTGKSIKSIWIIIGSIFAAPIALPLAIAAVCLAVALFIVICSLLFTFYVLSISFAVTGICACVFSFFTIPTNIGTFFLMLGLGLVCAALSIFVFIPTLFITKKFFVWFGNLINTKIIRRKNNA